MQEGHHTSFLLPPLALSEDQAHNPCTPSPAWSQGTLSLGQRSSLLAWWCMAHKFGPEMHLYYNKFGTNSCCRNKGHAIFSPGRRISAVGWRKASTQALGWCSFGGKCSPGCYQGEAFASAMSPANCWCSEPQLLWSSFDPFAFVTCHQ